jgi:hypothetical protein
MSSVAPGRWAARDQIDWTGAAGIPSQAQGGADITRQPTDRQGRNRGPPWEAGRIKLAIKIGNLEPNLDTKEL